MASLKALAGAWLLGQCGPLEAVASPPSRVSVQNAGGHMGIFAAVSIRKKGSEMSPGFKE